MLSIPKGVSSKHAEELEVYQKQIRIFVRNHQILRHRYDKSIDSLERGVLRGQIDTLEKYLLQWNDKQKPVLDKIREEVKDVTKRKGRKRGSKASSLKATPSNSPCMSDTESNEAASAAIVPPLVLLPGQFSGYVTSYDKFTPEGYLDLKERLRSESETEDDFSLPRIERVISNVHRNEFMNNLDLIIPSDLDELREKAAYVNSKRIQYRNLTYIPELSEKKNRIDYNYWRGEYNASPPTLRTRARVTANSHYSTRSSRSSSSRAASPMSLSNPTGALNSNAVVTPSLDAEDSKKKSLEPASPTTLDNKRPERKILSSNSLITRKNANVLALEKKLKELRETIAEFGPRTISTRKERTRRNELLAEELKLSKKVAKLQNKKI